MKKKKIKCCYCENKIEEGHAGFRNEVTAKKLCAKCFTECLSSTVGALLFPADKRFVFRMSNPDRK